jgi:hypothetical protein
MDKVIFTGVVPLDEFKEERPREYEELKKSGALRKRVMTAEITQKRERMITIFGYSALMIGIGLIGLIIYSMMFGYK